jgi:hypothetical protein
MKFAPELGFRDCISTMRQRLESSRRAAATTHRMPGETRRMKKTAQLLMFVTAFLLAICMFAVISFAGAAFTKSFAAPSQSSDAQASPTTMAPNYTPKFHGDPARSDSEAAALAYMRVVMRAEVGFNKQYGHYATSLAQLVHSGTFTQRMVNPDRGDYTVGYKTKKDNYILTMTPKLLDAQHRSFYAENDGKIHADDAEAADGESQVVETHRW